MVACSISWTKWLCRALSNGRLSLRRSEGALAFVFCNFVVLVHGFGSPRRRRGNRGVFLCRNKIDDTYTLIYYTRIPVHLDLATFGSDVALFVQLCVLLVYTLCNAYRHSNAYWKVRISLSCLYTVYKYSQTPCIMHNAEKQLCSPRQIQFGDEASMIEKRPPYSSQI